MKQFVLLTSTEEQAQFNKFVREEVTKRFGENFLLQHEVNQLESSIMDIIKSKHAQIKCNLNYLTLNAVLR